MLHAGIDEAGYGPTLGPLVVATAWAEACDHAALTAALAGNGVKDSKSLHRPGDLGPLEAVALGGVQWATGTGCATAADLFACLGEAEAERTSPWMRGAAGLRLPVAARTVPVWSAPGVVPGGVAGRIIHPAGYNRFLDAGGNKAELELTAVRTLLCTPPASAVRTTTVDRLGGRKFYRDALTEAFPGALVLVESETPGASRYRIIEAGREHAVGFVVGGESASPLTALASCVAKYARELHMLLFNRWWGAQVPGLKPTAGYPEDAKRWLREAGVAPDDREVIRIERRAGVR